MKREIDDEGNITFGGKYKGKFVRPDSNGPEFAADSPKGAIKRRGAQARQSRITTVDETEIEDLREIWLGDPHVNRGLRLLTQWIAGDGFNINPKNIPGTEHEQTQEEIAPLVELIARSPFEHILKQWILFALGDGHAFMELVVEDEQFKPRLLPTGRMSVETDEFGFVVEYILETPDGDEETYDPHEVAELWFVKEPLEDIGQSMVTPIREQADILRDMEIDYARFVATKAYPPIYWSCGTEEEKWSDDQIAGWLETVEAIEPDSMLAGPHDVEAEVVGVTATSSTAGAMRLEETFKHFENRIATGLGIPAMVFNMPENAGQPEAVMPSFKRHVTDLRRTVKEAVEHQILKSILAESSVSSGDGDFENFTGVIPEFEFGEHSSAEKRLELDKLLMLFNNGFLTREAFAERAGIDPETEMPDEAQLTSEIIPLILQLAGRGDDIQNPEGGHPSDTGGGTRSSGEEVTSRQSPTTDESDDSQRPRQSVTEDENA